METRKTVIVTGASSGLGAATACWLARQSAAIALVSRSRHRLEKVALKVKRLGGQPLIVPADVADPEACQKAVEITLERFARIDSLVNNAGVIAPLARIESSDIKLWRRTIDVNLLGPYYLTRAAVPALIEAHGRIVNVSSGAARTPIPSASAYCASKAGLTHFTRVAAAEVPQVTVLSVRPGVVDTPMQDLIRSQGAHVMSKEQFAYYVDLKKHDRLEPPETPGRSIAWLALHAPNSMSGEFRNYDDPDIAGPARALYGPGMDMG